MLGFSKDRTSAMVSGAQETLYKVILVLLTVTALLWMSIFLYATFYYSYMPPVSHTRPVHLQFRSCGRGLKGMCSFPSANVTLTKREHFLMVGQPYKIVLELEMPESPANQNLGMFMVCTRLKNREQDLVAKSCRSAMIQYKSALLHAINTFALSPFLLSGSSEEKQKVTVELFSNFQEDRNHPVTSAYIQLQSHNIEVYRTNLRIHAHFTGLRYVMFNYPIFSGFIGISTNLFFLSIVAFLSWYKFFTPKQVSFHTGYDFKKAQTLEERRVLAKQRLLRERGKVVSTPLDTGSQLSQASNKADLESPIGTKGEEADESDDGEEEEDQCVPDKEKLGESSSDELSLEPETKEELKPHSSSDEFVVIPTPTTPSKSAEEIESEAEEKSTSEKSQTSDTPPSETDDDSSLRKRK